MTAEAELQPTLKQTFVENTLDALIILSACKQALLRDTACESPPRPIMRRLRAAERSKLVKSGNVFVYNERTSKIRRWTDGLSWSPSRALGNFLAYRQLQDGKGGRKARGTKHRDRASSAPLAAPAATSSSQSSRISEGFAMPGASLHSSSSGDSPLICADAQDLCTDEGTRRLLGSLVDTFDFKKGGLMKKTMSITLNGDLCHIVAYYKPEDVIQQRLKIPSQTSPFEYPVKLDTALCLSQTFRISPYAEICGYNSSNKGYREAPVNMEEKTLEYIDEYNNKLEEFAHSCNTPKRLISGNFLGEPSPGSAATFPVHDPISQVSHATDGIGMIEELSTDPAYPHHETADHVCGENAIFDQDLHTSLYAGGLDEAVLCHETTSFTQGFSWEQKSRQYTRCQSPLGYHNIAAFPNDERDRTLGSAKSWAHDTILASGSELLDCFADAAGHAVVPPYNAKVCAAKAVHALQAMTHRTSEPSYNATTGKDEFGSAVRRTSGSNGPRAKPRELGHAGSHQSALEAFAPQHPSKDEPLPGSVFPGQEPGLQGLRRPQDRRIRGNTMPDGPHANAYSPGSSGSACSQTVESLLHSKQSQTRQLHCQHHQQHRHLAPWSTVWPPAWQPPADTPASTHEPSSDERPLLFAVHSRPFAEHMDECPAFSSPLDGMAIASPPPALAPPHLHHSKHPFCREPSAPLVNSTGLSS